MPNCVPDRATDIASDCATPNDVPVVTTEVDPSPLEESGDQVKASAARHGAGAQFLEDFGLSFDVPFTNEDIQASVDAYLSGQGVFDSSEDEAA